MHGPSTLDVATIDTLDTLPALQPEAPAPQPQTEVEPRPRWSLATRIAFRFSFLYFSLYVVSTQMLGGLVPLPNLASASFFQRILTWTGIHVFRLAVPPSFQVTGSGDKMVDYLEVFVLLAAAASVTAIWSLVDRRRPNYRAIHKWFRVFLRFALGTTMIGYGMAKFVPLQMPAPGLQRLLEPFGNFSPMGVLWYSIGASKSYEIFAGSMEVICAVLLFIPGLSTLGAMVTFATMLQVFMLNMTYDVPVKLFSFHLIVMALVLIAPEASRIANVVVFNRAAGPSRQPPLFRRRWLALGALALQLGFGAYVVLEGYAGARQSWWQRGGGAPKFPLYGIWDIEKMTIDGQTRSPLVTDYGRWRRVIFQTAAGVSFQRMDSSFLQYPAKIDLKDRTLTITPPVKDAPAPRFTIERPDPQHLILDGQMDGHTIRMETRRFDHSQMLLLTRGLNWIQERPFNR